MINILFIRTYVRVTDYNIELVLTQSISTMTSPPCQVNNFVQKKNTNIENRKTKIDMVSKFIMFSECIFGIFRISIINITNNKIKMLMGCYYVVVLISMFYIYIRNFEVTALQIVYLIDLNSFCACSILGNLLHERVFKFYVELNKLDDEIEYKTSATKNIAYIVFLITVAFIICVLHFYQSYTLKDDFLASLFALLNATFHILELHYYGHLFCLLIPRIRLMENYLKLSCSKNQSDKSFYVNSSQEFDIYKTHQQKNPSKNLLQLTRWYNKMILIHDCLNSAIKWQVCSKKITLSTVLINLKFSSK